MAENRLYDKEYKVQAVSLANDIGQAKAAKELGIPKNTLYGWVRANRLGTLGLGVGSHTPESAMTLNEELVRLRQQVKEMYRQFQQSRNKDKFIRETDGAESDVMLHETAKRYLSTYKKEHGTVPKSAELKPLLATLQKEKSALYEQYKKVKAEQGELMKLHMNLQKILGKDRNQ